MTGQQLKELRAKLDLSVNKSARQCEVSPRTWARWESGKLPIPDGAVKLFKILNGVTE